MSGEEADATGRAAGRSVRNWIVRTVGAFLALIALSYLLLNSPIGKRFIADQIAAAAPASGLKIQIGRIDGDVFGKAILRDMTLLDPKGEFLTVPEVDLDWRPLSWICSGLDVRNLVAKRGTLLRTPELLPGDPDAPLLPDFDIRIDHFEISDLTIRSGVVGDQQPVVDLVAKADVRDGRVYFKADSNLGAEDRLFALIDAEPDGDRFDIDLDYRAPKGGVLAGLMKSGAGYTARLLGKGTWHQWDGAFTAHREGERLASIKLTNRAGKYSLSGQAYPSAELSGLARAAAGERVSIIANGTLENSVVDGNIRVVSGAINATGEGAIDLANNAVDAFALSARLRQPGLFGDGITLERTLLKARLDGSFRDLTVDHDLQVGALASGDTKLQSLRQQGSARFDGERWSVPLKIEVETVSTGNSTIDPRLRKGVLTGTLGYAGSKLASDDLKIAFPDIGARFSLRGDTSSGAYALIGPVQLRRLLVEDFGTIAGRGKVDLRIGTKNPWQVRTDFDARIAPLANSTIANIAGTSVTALGSVGLGSTEPVSIRNVRIKGQKLSLALNGKTDQGATRISGTGQQADYGDFTVEASLGEGGPRAALLFANPLPAAGLKDVRLTIAGDESGYDIDAEGESLLGEFSGAARLTVPEKGPAGLAIGRLNVWRTSITGDLALVEGGANGALKLNGGGLTGKVGLAVQDGGQGFAVDLNANGARFGGATQLTLAGADVEARGYLKGGNSTIAGNARATGISYGSLFIGQTAVQAKLDNGQGNVTASISGRRGSRFALQSKTEISSDRIKLNAQGQFAGRRISMPGGAVFTALGDGVWQLRRTQLSYGNGTTLIAGKFGGGTTSANLSMSKMPLSLIDIAFADLGLGGTISGEVDFSASDSVVPSGLARVKIDNLTRSGLVLTSSPMDVSLVSRLSAERLEARAVVEEDGQRRGRLQAQITGLPKGGGLVERLNEGNLIAQLRYNGPAAALWRLTGVEGFDLTGPLSARANIIGTLVQPNVKGSVASDNLRVQSSLSGTDIRDVSTRGTFTGSRLALARFAGVTANGGSVSGSGTIDLDNLTQHGPELDIKIAAKNAALLDAAGLSATVTGPLRIVSDGYRGTIAGRIAVERASWRLGTAAESSAALPEIRTREINVRADIGPQTAPRIAWRYLIDAKARSRVDVDGMGLDSEWQADIQLRGTTADPRIGGNAKVIRGDYTFAGSRFELTRGRIEFDASVPIDPRLDIVAESDRDGLDVTVQVQGNALNPEISFSSNPLLPQEEILARLLYGGSVTTLSATDALQLGAALASLNGGAGLDPINKLRGAIGLDRLRIVSADPALNRETGLALGKNIGRKFYVEIITDGRGYSATEAEYRATAWLSLLASVSTVGRESVRAEISRDY